VLLFTLSACRSGPQFADPLPLPAGKSFAQNPNLLPGGMIAVVAGAPGEAGPYATRVSLPADFKVMPHTHPDARLYTVISGTFTIGLGTEVDSTKLAWLQAGDVYVLPANTPHYHWTVNGPTIFQVSGIGPTGTRYLRDEDDPRKR
jgi:quercetin dioxygenase-like cupin family protein